MVDRVGLGVVRVGLELVQVVVVRAVVGWVVVGWVATVALVGADGVVRVVADAVTEVASAVRETDVVVGAGWLVPSVPVVADRPAPAHAPTSSTVTPTPATPLVRIPQS